MSRRFTAEDARTITRGIQEGIKSILSCNPDSVIGKLVSLNDDGTGNVEVNGEGGDFTYPHAPFSDSKLYSKHNLNKAVILVFLDRNRQVYQILGLAVVIAYAGDPRPPAPPVAIIWSARLGNNGSMLVPEGSQGAFPDEGPPYGSLVTLGNFTCLAFLRTAPEALYFVRQASAHGAAGEFYLQERIGNDTREAALEFPSGAVDHLTSMNDMCLLQNGDTLAAFIGVGGYYGGGAPCQGVLVDLATMAQAWGVELDLETHGTPYGQPRRIGDSIWTPSLRMPALSTPVLCMLELHAVTGEVISFHDVEYASGGFRVPDGIAAGVQAALFPMTGFDMKISSDPRDTNRIPYTGPDSFDPFLLDQVIWYGDLMIPRVQGGTQMIVWNPVTQERVAEVLGSAGMSGPTQGMLERYTPLTLVGAGTEKDRLLCAYEIHQYQTVEYADYDSDKWLEAFGVYNLNHGHVFIDQANYDLLSVAPGAPPTGDAGFDAPTVDPEGHVQGLQDQIQAYMEEAAIPGELVVKGLCLENFLGFELREAATLNPILRVPYDVEYGSFTEGYLSGTPLLVEGAVPAGKQAAANVDADWVKTRAWQVHFGTETPTGLEIFWYGFNFNSDVYGTWDTDTWRFETVQTSIKSFKIVYDASMQTFRERRYPPFAGVAGCYSHRDKTFYFGPANRMTGFDTGSGAVWEPNVGPVTIPTGDPLPDWGINDHTHACAIGALDTNTCQIKWSRQLSAIPWLNTGDWDRGVGSYDMTAVDVGTEGGFLINLPAYEDKSCLLRIDKNGNQLAKHPYQTHTGFPVPFGTGFSAWQGDNMPYQGGNLYLAEGVPANASANLKRLE